MISDPHEPQPPAPASPWELPATVARHDGWTGERMAAFCETLADTGLVVDACLAAGKSTNTAYALRRRNPLFAAAWEAALAIARERLADTLLARSIEGTVEQYYKDGQLVGERRVIDSRLGLAILRRLDRLADTAVPSSFPGVARALEQRGTATAERGGGARAPCLGVGTMDWDLALSALRSGDEDAVAEALAMLAGGEAHETHDPPNSPADADDADDEDQGFDLSDRCWKDESEDIWMTDFPPPPGFDRWQQGEWGGDDYKRECTAEEVELLEAGDAAELAEARAEEEQLRDAWFDYLRAEAEAEAEAEAQARTADAEITAT